MSHVRAACTLGALAVPTCGLLWGSRPSRRASGQFSPSKKVGRPFDIVYRYHDLSDTIPDEAERDVPCAGRSSTSPSRPGTSAAPIPGTFTWAEVAMGTYDESLRAQARGSPRSASRSTSPSSRRPANRPRWTASAQPPTLWPLATSPRALCAQGGQERGLGVGDDRRGGQPPERRLSCGPATSVVDWISWNVYNQSGLQER